MSYVNVDVDVDDIIGDIETSDLIEELESRGYSVFSELDIIEGDTKSEPFTIKNDIYNSTQLYRHLCDIVGCGYHEPRGSVLERLKHMI